MRYMINFLVFWWLWLRWLSSGMPSAEVTSPWKEASSEGMDSHHNPPAHKSITGLNGKYRNIIIVIIDKTALFESQPRFYA